MPEDTMLARVERPLNLPAELITDDEIRRLYRIAESLARSQMFKDVTMAEQAFAKMVIGRDLGMTPAQSMQGLHIVDGAVTVHYVMLAQFLRSRADEGYTYRTGWIKAKPYLAVEGQEPPNEREVVWMNEDDPIDPREIVGAVVEFKVHDELRGVSRFTIEDARAANLIKDNPKAAWNTARRNMFLARAWSNGVKWFVPEVLGGLPIYADGEIVPDNSITAPTGGGDAQGLDLGPKVEAIIERATVLGHAGLSNRPALEIALGNRAPGVVNQWLIDAKAELDRVEAAAKESSTDEPVDAEVVSEDDGPVGVTGIPGTGSDVLDADSDAVQRHRLAALKKLRQDESLTTDNKLALDEEITHVEGLLS